MATLPTNLVVGSSGHVGHSNQAYGKLNDLVIDAKADYGAVGDDSTDNATPLQNAINDAAVSDLDTVFVPPGTFRFGTQLDRKGVTLRGAGSIGGTTLRWSGAAGATAILGDSNNSRGGLEGITLDSATNEPATWLDLTGILVDQQFRLRDVQLTECSSDGIKVGDWVNIHWDGVRFDNVGGYAIRLTPTVGGGQYGSSFNLENFTYDHSRASSAGTGFLMVDNSVRNGTNLGPVRLANGRVEVNTAWGAPRALVVLKQNAVPTGNASIPVLLENVAYQDSAAMTDYVVYRDTTDTTFSEHVVWINCLFSSVSAFQGGTWPPSNNYPDVAARHALLGALDIASHGTDLPLRLRNYTAGNVAMSIRNTFRGGAEIGGTYPLQVTNSGGTGVGGFTNTGALMVGNSAAATTPGTVTKKIEVFDAAGVSLGFIAVYGSIT